MRYYYTLVTPEITEVFECSEEGCTDLLTTLSREVGNKKGYLIFPDMEGIKLDTKDAWEDAIWWVEQQFKPQLSEEDETWGFS
jgi:hypothetical protein